MATTPTEPIVSDEYEPDPYWELDEQARADFIAAEVFDWPLCPLCACPLNVCHRDGCCALKGKGAA